MTSASSAAISRQRTPGKLRPHDRGAFRVKHLRVYWAACVLIFAAVAAHATTIVLPTDEQLVAKSPIIVDATVISSVPVDRNGRIWTETTLAVTRALKGDVAGEIVVGEPGGVLGNRITKIYGAPEDVAGEHVDRKSVV